MALVAFHSIFPLVAAEETRVVALSTSDGAEIEVALDEFHCPDPQCDCRRMQVHFTDSVTGEVVAAVSHGYNPWTRRQEWDDEQTYLEPLSPQSSFAEDLLDLFAEELLTPEWEETLKRHTRMVREAVASNPKLRGLEGLDLLDALTGGPGGNTYRDPSPDVGRNDPCPCGSGRNYKKCCLRKEQQEEPQKKVASNRQKPSSTLRERAMAKSSAFAKEVIFAEGGTRTLDKIPNAEVLEEFALPLLIDQGREADDEDFEVALIVAMEVWNTLVAGGEIDDVEVFGRLKPIIGPTRVRRIWEHLSARKAELFPDDQRRFLDLEVRMTDEGPYLEVAAVFSDV